MSVRANEILEQEVQDSFVARHGVSAGCARRTMHKIEITAFGEGTT